jgi:RPA family protein
MALGKRYEIYLPLEYNPDEDGVRQSIEKEKFVQTHEELWQTFGGVTVTSQSDNQALRGFWLDQTGELFQDRVYTATVYTTDINRADAFCREAITRYKERFQQEAILILSWIVERIEP